MPSLTTEYWNGAAGDRWATSREEIDRSLAGVTGPLLDAAAPRPTDRVLDVGCGCGTTTLLLRDRAASVVGVDVSAPMLAVARARGGDVSFLLADAATHPFAPEHDLIFSRFGVMFFDDPKAAFANLRRALAPAGRLAFVCWQAFERNPWASVPMAAARGLIPEAPPADPHAPGPFAFADAGHVRDILGAAGYRDIAVEPRTSTMFLGATLEDAVASTLTIGPLARAAAEVDDATREVMRERLRVALAPFARAEGIAPDAAILVVTAT